MQLLLTAGCNEISYEGKRLLSLFCLTKRDTDRPEMHVSWMAHRRRKYLVKGAFSFAILCIMTSWASLRLFYTTQIIIISLSQVKTWISNVIFRGLFYGQWIEVRGGCSFCWYWWNYWLSLFRLYFHNWSKIGAFCCRNIFILFLNSKFAVPKITKLRLISFIHRYLADFGFIILKD